MQSMKDILNKYLKQIIPIEMNISFIKLDIYDTFTHLKSTKNYG